jgi:hypothetical protein
MDAFKFACPVCGQHISCDPAQAGSQMKCPTCFQKLVVPQAPSGAAAGYIITASKVSERPSSAIPRVVVPRPVEKKAPPLAAIGFFAVLIGVVVVGILYHDKIFRTASTSSSAETNPLASTSGPQRTIWLPLPPNAQTNWTLDLTNASISDLEAVGRVHGTDFHCERATLNGGNLNLRQGADWPPDLGASIHLGVARVEDLAGRSIYITPDQVRAPEVALRWKDVLRQPVKETLTNGYALRMMFGVVTNGQIPGKIYLCTTDSSKSWVRGSFDAQIRPPGSPSSPAVP